MSRDHIGLALLAREAEAVARFLSEQPLQRAHAMKGAAARRYRVLAWVGGRPSTLPALMRQIARAKVRACCCVRASAVGHWYLEQANEAERAGRSHESAIVHAWPPAWRGVA